MNKCIVDAKTKELIAYVSDEHESIVKDGYEIINFGENEPIFIDRNGIVYVKDNAFEIKL